MPQNDPRQSRYQQNRLHELDTCWQHEDLSRLTRRILDYLTDFPLEKSHRETALLLRKDYLLLIQARTVSGNHPQHAQTFAELQSRSREFLDELGHRATGAEPSSAFGEPPVSMDIEPPTAPTAPATTAAEPLEVGAEARDPGISTIFEAREVSITFSAQRKQAFRLAPLSFRLQAGELTGVVGENGHGKSVLLNIVAGQLLAEQGTTHYPGFDALGTDPVPRDWYAIRQQIGYIPQQLPKWFGSVREYLRFSASIHGIRGRQNTDVVDFMLHRLGLTAYAHAWCHELSGGYRVRVALAQILVWRPRLLVLDEPLAYLDINAQQTFLQDIRDLAHSLRHPISILISSQHLHEIERIVDRIIFLRHGQVLYNGPKEAFNLDRARNHFELVCSASLQQLQDILTGLDIQVSEQTGDCYSLALPREIDAREVLSRLIQKNITITYFRDISQSTRLLFQENARP